MIYHIESKPKSLVTKAMLFQITFTPPTHAPGEKKSEHLPILGHIEYRQQLGYRILTRNRPQLDLPSFSTSILSSFHIKPVATCCDVFFLCWLLIPADTKIHTKPNFPADPENLHLPSFLQGSQLLSLKIQS